MIDGADLVAAHRLQYLIRLRTVDVLVRPLTRGRLGRHRPQIGGNDTLGAQPLAQRRDQLRADLSQRACHENATHACPDLSEPPCCARSESALWHGLWQRPQVHHALSGSEVASHAEPADRFHETDQIGRVKFRPTHLIPRSRAKARRLEG